MQIPALLTLGAAIVHLSVAAKHLDQPFLLVAFLVIGLAQLGVVLVFFIRRSRHLLTLMALLNVGIIEVWAATRLVATPFLPGLETVQPVGLVDAVATFLEMSAVLLALWILSSPGKLYTRMPSGRISVALGGSVVLGVTGIAVAQPHVHHESNTAHPASEHRATHAVTGSRADSHHSSSKHTHAAAPVSWEQAEHELLPHVPRLMAANHQASGKDHTSSHASLAEGDGAEGAEHHESSAEFEDAEDHSDHAETAREERYVILKTDSVFKNWKAEVAYEPATDERGAAIRYTDANSADNRHHLDAPCKPTAKQRAIAEELLRGTVATIARYDNNPRLAISEGFLPYPIAGKKMFHIFNSRRYRDPHVLVPSQIETFMYAMTDEGLKAVGGMFVYAPKDRTPPNPTGCILQWHQHTGTEGLISSFDPDNPDKSMWMAHVWTYGGLPHWRESKDGTESHSWFFGWRNVPMVCNGRGGCI